MVSLLSDPFGTPDRQVSEGAEVQPPLTPIQEAAREKILEDQPAPDLDVVSASIRSEWASSYLMDTFGSASFVPNLQWNPGTMSVDERKALNLDKRLPEFVDQIFSSSVSFEHAQSIVKSQDERMEAENVLERAGVGGVAARLAATFLDPTSIAIAVATDGVATPFLISNKITRANRAIRLGLLNSAASAAATAAVAINDPLRDENDVFIAATAGLLLGGALGHLTHNPTDEIASLINKGRTDAANSIENGIAVEEALAAGVRQADNVIAPPSPRNSDWFVHIPEDGTPVIVRTTADPPNLPTREGLARQADPIAIGEMDQLTTVKEQHKLHLTAQAEERAAGVDALPEVVAIDKALAVIERKFGNAGARATKNLNAQKEELSASRASLVKTILATDTPKMVATRRMVQETDERMRDMAPKVSAAYKIADEEIAKRPMSIDQVMRNARKDMPKAPPIPDTPVATPSSPQPPVAIETSGGSQGNAYVDPMTSSRTERAERVWQNGRVQPSDVSWRADLYAYLTKSEHPGVSWLADKLIPDGVGYRAATGSAQARTVVEDKEMLFKTVVGKTMREYHAAYHAWAKETGRSIPSLNMSARRDFGEAVGEAITNPNAQVSATVRRAANAIDNNHRELGEMAKRAEVAGFKELVHEPTYMMRVVNWAKFNQLDNLHGTSTLINLVKEAIRRAPGREVLETGGPRLTHDAADKMAYLWVQWQKHSAFSSSQGMSQAFNSDIVNKLKEQLTETMARHAGDKDFGPIVQSITKEDLDGFISNVFNVGQAGVIGRGKYRIAMDESFSLMHNGRELKIADMFERDAERLVMRYSHEMAGAITLARHPDLNIKSMSHWQQHVSDLEETAQKYFGANTDAFLKQMQGVEVARRHLFGQPTNTLTGVNAAMFRIVRDWNFTRLMGKAGLAQATELGNVMGQAGWINTLRHMPILKTIVRDAKSGKLNHEFADELEGLLGIGNDRLLSAPSASNFDGQSGIMKAVGKVEDAQAFLKRVTSDFSGLGPLTDVQERIATSAAIQKFANMAHGGDELSPKRLASMGLNPDDTTLVLREMKAHVSDTTSGLTGRTIKTLNFEQWDPQARELFRTALWRWSRRMIQKNNIGDLPLFMSHWTAQLLFQFRSFSFAAWPKQLVHGVRMADAQTVSSFLTSTLFGGLGYVALTYNNSVGRADRKEYLEKNLTPQKIGAMSFARAGYSSILPSTLDTGLSLIGEDPLFSGGRTTGMESSFISGNPTSDIIENSLPSTLKAATSPFRGDRQFSQQDVTNIARLVPLNNLFIVGSGIKMMSQGLPPTSTTPK